MLYAVIKRSFVRENSVCLWFLEHQPHRVMDTSSVKFSWWLVEFTTGILDPNPPWERDNSNPTPLERVARKKMICGTPNAWCGLQSACALRILPVRPFERRVVLSECNRDGPPQQPNR